jgi:hypothetical protein
MEFSRADLLSLVDTIREGDLALGRRGSWNIAQILEHIIKSESLIYAGGIRQIRGAGKMRWTEASAPPISLTEARASLEASRRELLEALEGVDEESFYRLELVAGQDYSVLSILENVASHEREHAAQIRETLA